MQCAVSLLHRLLIGEVISVVECASRSATTSQLVELRVLIVALGHQRLRFFTSGVCREEQVVSHAAKHASQKRTQPVHLYKHTHLCLQKGQRGNIGQGTLERHASDAGANSKVGAHVQTKKIYRAPPHFGSMSTISRFGERFRDGQYSLVSFLFAALLLTVPPVPSHL